MTTVNISNLSKTYAGSTVSGANIATKTAVDDLSLAINSGEFVALLGPSGCGKTSTLKMIAGLVEPDHGDIRFDNKSVVQLKPERREASMVFQNHLLFPHLNVFDNVAFGLKMRREQTNTIDQQVMQLLERVQLAELSGRQTHELSGGQQQRVALARAMVTRPNVLLLDEPLSSLDADLRAEMRSLIRDLQSEWAVTTIMVTHDQLDAEVLADRIALMMDGQLKQFDQPEALVQRPADEAVARFFGGENFFPGEVKDGSFNGDIGVLDLTQKTNRENCVVTIRPENILLRPRESSAGLNETASSGTLVAQPQKWFLARLVTVTKRGSYLHLGALVNNVKLGIVCHMRELANAQPGDRVEIAFPPDALWLMG